VQSCLASTHRGAIMISAQDASKGPNCAVCRTQFSNLGCNGNLILGNVENEPQEFILTSNGRLIRRYGSSIQLNILKGYLRKPKDEQRHYPLSHLVFSEQMHATVSHIRATSKHGRSCLLGALSCSVLHVNVTAARLRPERVVVGGWPEGVGRCA